MLELFPQGFEEVDLADGIELVAYTDASGEERLWHVFGGVRGQDVAADWRDRWKARLAGTVPTAAGLTESEEPMWWRRRTETRAQTDDTQPDRNLPFIRLKGVSKVFKGDADDETWALRDVTVDIGRGEYISVSGPSGCGKSTFLAVLALLESMTAGRYWLNGRPVDRCRLPSAPGPGTSRSGSSFRASISSAT